MLRIIDNQGLSLSYTCACNTLPPGNSYFPHAVSNPCPQFSCTFINEPETAAFCAYQVPRQVSIEKNQTRDVLFPAYFGGIFKDYLRNMVGAGAGSFKGTHVESCPFRFQPSRSL